jgi:16S rRNA processing protein RimM
LINDKEFTRIARIVGAHALNGRLKVYVISDIPDRFKKGNRVFLELKEGFKKYIISDFKEFKGSIALLGLEGVNNRTDADMLKNIDVCIDFETAEKGREFIDKDAFFYRDIIGVAVFHNNVVFGKVIDLFEAGAGEILVIENEEKREVLVPFVESMVNTDRIKDGIIEISPVEGLLDF